MNEHPTVVPPSRRVIDLLATASGNTWYVDDSPHLADETLKLGGQRGAKTTHPPGQIQSQSDKPENAPSSENLRQAVTRYLTTAATLTVNRQGW